ncbi:hypothetical protein BJ878DRAFT_567095 [Calycina marina]|uniref:Uncharacterized protein n=1 Tax=Calycina marina TaxID=1763456 RepID=A0A9P7Z409_9HELO|nr:hypothetical protein BJ878DRAFT_567095 [Calycina marina]
MTQAKIGLVGSLWSMLTLSTLLTAARLFCIVPHMPLPFNPIAYAAWETGFVALEELEDDTVGGPRFLPEGTLVSEKEKPVCAEVCKSLTGDVLAYAACTGGYAAGIDREKN